jgi:hypothetical protein
MLLSNRQQNCSNRHIICESVTFQTFRYPLLHALLASETHPIVLPNFLVTTILELSLQILNNSRCGHAYFII